MLPLLGLTVVVIKNELIFVIGLWFWLVLALEQGYFYPSNPRLLGAARGGYLSLPGPVLSLFHPLFLLFDLC